MRTYTRTWFVSALSLAATMLLLGSHRLPVAQGQPPQAPTPAISGGFPGVPAGADPLFEKGFTLKELYRYEEAASEYLRLAAAYPDSEIEAAARYKAAGCLNMAAVYARPQDPEKASRLENDAIALWQLNVQRFPGTKYWLDANLELVAKLHTNTTSNLLVQVGGVPLEDIRSGRTLRIAEDQVAPQLREYVASIYITAGLRSSDASSTEVAECLRLLLFVRRSFPTTHYDGSLMEHILYAVRAPESTQPDTTPPQVTIVGPPEGGTVSPNSAALQVEMTDGNVLQNQIDILKSRVQLDGADVFGQCLIDSQIDPDGPFFERLTVRYQPPQPLSLGQHSYRILAVDNGLVPAPSTERVVNFTVSDQPPPPLTLSLEVLSKHVKPNKGELARVRVTATNPPSVFWYSIRRQGGGQTVFTSPERLSTTGSVDIIWDGLDMRGSRVSNGSYDVVLNVRDSSGRVVSKSALVVVNF